MKLDFQQLPPRPQRPRPVKPYDRWVSPDGEETALFFRDSAGYLVRFPDLADFAIALEQRTVICTPAPDVSEAIIEDLYFNQIVPLAMGRAGDLVLHASAVLVEGKAVAFLGATRRGKSTLTAAFARAGHPFLTDDGLILREEGADFSVHPRRPALRLCADSEAAVLHAAAPPPLEDDTKVRIDAGAHLPHHDGAVPLGALYLLPEPLGRDRVHIAPLPRTEALSELLKHSFILDVEDRALIAGLFGRLAHLAERVGCFSLDYPRRYADLPNVLSSIMTHLRSGETG